MLFLMRMVKFGAILPRNWLRRHRLDVFSLPPQPPTQHAMALLSEERKEWNRVVLGCQLGLGQEGSPGAHLTEAPSSTGHQPDTSQVLAEPW